MEELIKVTYNENYQQPVVSSLQIAEDFGKRHDKLLSEIERMYGDYTDEGCAENGGDPLFYKTSYIHPQNKQEYPMYLMNRDGFSLLVMGFTGKDALDWKLKYINAFNEMEKQIKELPKLPSNPQEILKLIVLANEQTDKKVEKLRNDVDEKFNDMPLFNVECQELEKAVRKKGTSVLGGYHSPAYNDRSTRTKVYEDIHKQVKREFGVNTYKAINRIHYGDAIKIINSYTAPVVMREEINRINSQQCMDLNVDGGAK